jgi:hypothetical protein
MAIFHRAPIAVLETDVNQGVAGGLRPSWLSGTPANLADGAASVALFDLGPDWDQYTILTLIVRSTTAISLSAITASSRDDPVAAANPSRYLREDCLDAGGPSILSATVSTASVAGATRVRPSGRYLAVTFTNTAGGGAQGPSSKITVTAYPA